MTATHPIAQQMLDEQRARDEQAAERYFAKLEQLTAHLPVCSWCDGKAAQTEDRETRRAVIRCYWCRRQTLGPRKDGVRLWRRF